MVTRVPGGREGAAQAAREAAETTYYASHVFNPLFLEGTKSMAHEVYVQAGFPDTVFVPAGNGTLLLGTYLGFKELGFLPRIVAVGDLTEHVGQRAGVEFAGNLVERQHF